MTDRQAGPEPPADAVYPDEFAEMLGVKRTTIRHYVQQTRARSAAAPVGFPLPAGKALREYQARTEHQPVRRVWVPWWNRADARRYQRERLPSGYQGPRADDEEGKKSA